MVRSLIIPGLDGSDAPHWQHWWAMSDPSALVVDLTDPAHPEPRLHETELSGMILRHPDSILVAHSLGAVLVARVLTKFPQLRVRGALLVAPAEPQGKPRIQAFAPLPERPLGVPSMVVASRNDPWMPFARARALADAWGSGFHDAGFAGHINAAAGFGPWPAGKRLRDQLIAQSLTNSDPALAQPAILPVTGHRQQRQRA